MFTRIRKAQENDEGFTLIELLVVMIIIGILAAIAIPTFLNQRENGWRAQAISDLRNAVTNAETYAVANNGSYLSLAQTDIQSGISTSNSDLAVVGTPTEIEFCISATSVNGPEVSYLKSTDTTFETGDCTVAP